MFWASSAHLQEEYSCIHAEYGTVTLYESDSNVIERDSTICCMYATVFFLKMRTWGSKHVEENIILWINNNQCIKLVINVRGLEL